MIFETNQQDTLVILFTDMSYDKIIFICLIAFAGSISSLIRLSFLARANEASEPSLDGMVWMKSEKQLYDAGMDR